MKLNLNEILIKVEAAYEGLSPTCRLTMAAAAATRLKRQHPLAIILIGGPSSGKSSLLLPFTKAKPDTSLGMGVLRVDEFTPASLVSHSANRTEEMLQKIDLLPKLANRCVIVKEMAPMFTGHEDELTRKLSVLASVLDGEGYVSSSGSHGQRGYTDPIVFTLLGAVTPSVLTSKVHDAMSAIGPRFCFWEMPTRRIETKKWRGHSKDRKSIENAAAESIISYMDDLFKTIPAGSIDREEFDLNEANQALLSTMAILMASLRSKVVMEKGDFEDSSPITTSESPERAYRYLEQVILGSALLEERRTIKLEDLQLACGLAIGSAHPTRRRLLQLFMAADRPRTVHDITVRFGKSDDTVRKYALLLEGFEIVEKVNWDGPSQWDLKEPFKELRRALFFPTSPQEKKHDDIFEMPPEEQSQLF